MRQRFLVTYDICDPKRLRDVFDTMKGFGRHVQLSVFQCDLTSTRLAELKVRLKDIVDPMFDQVLFFDLGPSDGRGLEVVSSVGRPYVHREEGPVIV